MKKRKTSILGLFLILPGIMLSCVARYDLPRAENLLSTPNEQSEQKYYLQPGDTMEVKFFYNPELNETVIIRPDGKISLQLIGEVTAAGITPSDLNKLLVQKYTGILRKSELTVIVKGFEGEKVYIGGEVVKPGVFPLINNTTILQAIVSAGGFRETAQPGSIIIISKDLRTMPVARQINLNKVMSGEAPEADIFIRPFDIIYVPKSFIAKADKFVEQYITKIIPGALTGGFSYVIGRTRVDDKTSSGVLLK